MRIAEVTRCVPVRTLTDTADDSSRIQFALVQDRRATCAAVSPLSHEEAPLIALRSLRSHIESSPGVKLHSNPLTNEPCTRIGCRFAGGLSNTKLNSQAADFTKLQSLD